MLENIINTSQTPELLSSSHLHRLSMQKYMSFLVRFGPPGADPHHPKALRAITVPGAFIEKPLFYLEKVNAGSAAQTMGCLPDGLASIASSEKQKRTCWLSPILWVRGRVWR